MLKWGSWGAYHETANICPYCERRCERSEFNRTYVFEACACSIAPFTHRIERIYHRRCVERESWVFTERVEIERVFQEIEGK